MIKIKCKIPLIISDSNPHANKPSVTNVIATQRITTMAITIRSNMAITDFDGEAAGFSATIFDWHCYINQDIILTTKGFNLNLICCRAVNPSHPVHLPCTCPQFVALL